MKRTDILVIATCCVLAVVAGFTLKHCQRTLPERKCSQVYQRYAHVEGIQAAYVKDYRINDTLTVAVTLLEATDSAGWEYLMKQLNITPEMQMVLKQRDIFEWQSPRGKPEIRAITKGEGCDTSLTENDIEICTCSFNRLQMCVFHTRTKNEVAAIRNYNYNEMATNVNYHEKDN